MSNLIVGEIAANVDIEIDIRHSCNVYLVDDATATLTNARLIGKFIDGTSNNDPGECLTGCMNVNIKDSANIIGKGKENDVTLQTSSTLEENSIEAECLTNAHIGLHKRHVANIIGARDVTVDASRLAEDNVEVIAPAAGNNGLTSFTTITGHVSDVGTIHASRRVFVRSVAFLVDSLVDLNGDVTGTTVHLEGHNVGSVVGGAAVTVDGGSALVSDIVTGATIGEGTAIMVDIDWLGDVISHGTVTITNSDLVQDVVNLGTITAANDGDVIVNIHGKGIGSVHADDLTLTDGGGTASLVESLLTFGSSPSGLNYNIKVEDVGNAKVHGIVTLNDAANLIESIVDCEIAAGVCVAGGEDLIIRLTNGGNVLCPNGRKRAESSLIIDVANGAELVQAIFRTDNANAEANSVTLMNS